MCVKSNQNDELQYIVCNGTFKTKRTLKTTVHWTCQQTFLNANRGPKFIGTIAYLLYKILMRFHCIWSSKRENGSRGSWKITFLT